jgi:hypothetical protein
MTTSQHLKVLSPIQRLAFDSLGLGPQWLPRGNLNAPQVVDDAANVNNAIMIVGSHWTEKHTTLIGNMLQCIGVSVADVVFSTFDVDNKANIILQLGPSPVPNSNTTSWRDCSVFEFPTAQSMLGDPNSKAAAWVILKAVKKMLQ